MKLRGDCFLRTLRGIRDGGCSAFALLLVFSISIPTLHARVLLPETLRLAGPLDAGKTFFGDEFFNFTFGSASGVAPLRGWIEVHFSPPDNDRTDFRVFWHAVGEDQLLVFPDGHFYIILGEQTYSSGVQVSQGRLNLETGLVERIRVHAVFNNSFIYQILKANLMPLSSERKQGRFSPLNVDFPVPPAPISLPYDERPSMSANARFLLDSSGRITGFEFSGESFAPITVLPDLAVFPPYSFSADGQIRFLAPDGCVPDTPASVSCVSPEENPDGIDLPYNAFLHPSLLLFSNELREVPIVREVPSCTDEPIALATAVTLADSLYLLGGVGPKAAARERVLRLDRQSGEWEDLPKIPKPVLGAGAAAVGGKIYVAGGRPGLSEPPTRLLQVFDPATLDWSVSESIPVPVSDAVVASAAGRLFVIGGTSGNSDVYGGVQVFDAVTQEWSSGAPMPVGTSGSASAVVGSDIYVISGRVSEGDVIRDVWIYQALSDRWVEGPRTDRGVYRATASFLDGRIYLSGGGLDGSGPVDSGDVLFNRQRMQVLEFSLGRWTVGIEPPVPTIESTGAVVGNEIYVIGGRTGSRYLSDEPTTLVQIYSPAQGWELCSSQPVFTADTVVNTASFGVGPAQLSAGSQASILGHNLASSDRTAPPIRFRDGFLTTDLPFELGGVTVAVNGHAAPLLRVGPERVDFVVPYEASGDEWARVELSNSAVEHDASPVRVELAPAAPGIFIHNHGETRALDYLREAAAIAYNPDGKMNFPSQPVERGAVITLLATGLGPVSPSLRTGQRAPSELRSVVMTDAVVTIDGRTAKIESAGLLANHAGVYELRVVVPADAREGNRVPVEVFVNGIRSNRAVISVASSRESGVSESRWTGSRRQPSASARETRN